MRFKIQSKKESFAARDAVKARFKDLRNTKKLYTIAGGVWDVLYKAKIFYVRPLKGKAIVIFSYNPGFVCVYAPGA